MTVSYAMTRTRILAAALSVAMAASAHAQDASLAQRLDPQRNAETFSEDHLKTGRAIAKGGAQAGGVSMKCMACHGLAGAGGAQAPRLAALPYDYLVTQIQYFLNGNRASAIMAPISARLTPQEVHAVLAYYADLPPPDMTPPADLDWELVRAGELLAYAGRQQSGEAAEITACVMCHNAVGDLDRVPIAPPLAGHSAGYITDQLKAWRSGLRRGSPLGVMSRIAEAMTDEEIAAVAAFYAAQNPAETEAD
ncbi:c-type cytochrome [Marivita sp. S0852]|uniref:c-type cytochrome n=1 Tax=Marivita sp. S0852 TaxID=3373893 RepID=UPI003981A03A